jgi:hypothetical protein
MKRIFDYLNNKWTLLIAITSVILLIITNRLYQKPNKPHSEWRYEVRGFVNYKGQLRDAIWYSDTIEVGENYLRYENSDGSEVIIPAPYVLIDHKYDLVKKDTTSAF